MFSIFYLGFVCFSHMSCFIFSAPNQTSLRTQSDKFALFQTYYDYFLSFLAKDLIFYFSASLVSFVVVHLLDRNCVEARVLLLLDFYIFFVHFSDYHLPGMYRYGVKYYLGWPRIIVVIALHDTFLFWFYCFHMRQ